jgi:hypothetical protein
MKVLKLRNYRIEAQNNAQKAVVMSYSSLGTSGSLLLLLTANGFSPGGSGTTIRQQTNNTLTTIRQHTI